MAFETKNPTSFADIISLCNETKSDRGRSPVINYSEPMMETLSLRSKSPSSYSVDSNAWSSPVQKEALELSARKRNAVLNMIEKNWKINIRTKIETDLTDQVQQALAPLTSLRRKTEKKKSDKQKSLQVFRVNNYNRSRYSQFSNNQSGGGGAGGTGGSFKYIDVNYIPQHKFLAGRDGRFYSKDVIPRSLAQLRLPKRHEVASQSMYQFDELARAQKHASNIRGGLDVTLLDSNSSVSFLSLPKHEDSELRPLVPNVINYNGISLPNYGASRRCFQTYTKEGMNNLLSSRTRRGKLTQLGDGKFVDKRGVIISRLGPFWPQGYGPVCPCPEFIVDCPEEEELLPIEDAKPQSSDTTTQHNNTATSKSNSLSPRNCAIQNNTLLPDKSTESPQAAARISDKNDTVSNPASHPSINKHNSTNTQELKSNSQSNQKSINSTQHSINPNLHFVDSAIKDDSATAGNRPTENQRLSKSNKPSSQSFNPQPHWNQNNSNQLTPREGTLKPPINLGGKRQNNGKPVWKGKPVIYDCDRSSRSPLPHSVPDGMDESLIFESRFESGNLRQVRRIGEHEYELVLRTDMYTNRHTQWYYFRIQKAKQNRTYKFNIINFLKKDSLYNYGMKPLVYSEKLAASQELGWHRIGEHIKYAAWNNPTRNAILSLDMQYYCLEFELSFDWKEIEEDTVYLAHCYPYTYSDLRRHLDQIMSKPELSQHVKREVLCETTAGNACFLLTITDFPDREKDKYKDFHQEKRGVVITARVHPGESQSSWMMKGVIEHLISDHPIAKELRKKFVFKVVPMLNPDGVIVGNYRTSLAARDLNRNYRHPRQGIFPTIWHTKQMVDQFNKDHPIILYCDLHGHSRKHMVFMYGCERKAYYQKQNKKQNKNGNPEKPPEKEPDSLGETRDFVEERMFPWLMHKLVPTRFSFHGTKFAVRRSKEATGRVVMFRQMGIWNSFTMEASFSGTRMDRESGRHFNIDDFQLIGRKLCDCVLEYSQVCENPIAKSRAILEMTRAIAQQLLQNARLSTNNNNTSQANTNDAKSNLTSNQVIKKSSQLNRSNTFVNNSIPNYANVKSTISKQVRRNQNRQNNKTMQTNQGVDETAIDDLIESESSRQTDAIEDQPESKSAKNGFVKERSDVIRDVIHNTGDVSSSIAQEEEDVEKKEGVDENCFRLLQSLNIHNLDLESETSSESNSDSEPELPVDASSSLAKNRASLGNSSGGKKKKRKKRQQKYGKSISAPSKIQSLQNKKNGDEQMKDKAKPTVPTYPGYVNKYANRSNGGIPIFAQERMEERAARRLAELKLAENDRRNQESHLREQLLLAGIQDGPRIPYDVTISHKLTSEQEGYSDVCGVRYKVANPSQRVHYMISNPYRGHSPTSARDRRPVVTMRFSPPSQLRPQPVGGDVPRNKVPNETNVDLYMPYRVQAAGGRLSNQRGLSSLAELSGSVSESNPTEPSSSQSSEREDHADDIGMETPVSTHEIGKFEPRSVVVPLQKYNVSFNSMKKSWKQKTGGNLAVLGRPQDVEELDFASMNQENQEEDSSQHRPSNVADLVLPPNMDVAEVMTAHMRYPAQVHRIEAMRPLPRGRTISRGPPMIFGEPVPFIQKSQDFSAEPPNGITRFEKSHTNPSIFSKSKPAANQKPTSHDDVTVFENENGVKTEVHNTEAVTNLTNLNLKQSSPRVNPQPLFVPRFVALPPQRNGNQEEGERGNLTNRTTGEQPNEDTKSHSFTVR